MSRATLALVALIGLQGCAVLPFWPSERTRIDIAELSATTPPDRGIVVTTGDLDVAYLEIAVLTVGPRGLTSTEGLIADLRTAAARVGADAVVRVDFDAYADDDTGRRRIATGTAVKVREGSR